MDDRFDPLPWDTACFGFGVARWTGPLEAEALTAAKPSLEAAGIRLIYLFAPADAASDAVALEAGALRVDHKVVYGRVLPDAEPWAPASSFPIGEPVEDLVSLSLESGRYSRFRLDPRMPPRCFQALYEAWILRSTRREIADEVLTCGGQGKIEGMVTVRMDGETARIGLIAVAEGSRGKGLGRGLIRAAEWWARKEGCQRMEVATQGTNHRACALYEQCGYMVIESQHVYHLWIGSEVL